MATTDYPYRTSGIMRGILVILTWAATSLTAATAFAEHGPYLTGTNATCDQDPGLGLIRVVFQREIAPLLDAILPLREAAPAPVVQLAPRRDNRAGAIVLDGAPARMAWALSGWNPREPRYVHPLRVDLGARSLV